MSMVDYLMEPEAQFTVSQQVDGWKTRSQSSMSFGCEGFFGWEIVIQRCFFGASTGDLRFLAKDKEPSSGVNFLFYKLKKILNYPLMYPFY